MTIPNTKEEAQQRTDQIRAFRSELDLVEAEGIITLPSELKQRVADYHNAMLERLRSTFDVDTNTTDRQMSLGMRMVSFLGALALSAAIFFFFYRYWGVMPLAAQVTILVAAPFLLLLLTEFAARREKTLYFASLAALVTITTFVLNLSMLGQIFSITPSQNAFLAWGAFALLLAYAYTLKLPLVAGLASLAAYLSASMGAWRGIYWLSLGERPENFILCGLIIFAFSFLPHRQHPGFSAIYRGFGALVMMIAILVMSHWGDSSYFMLESKTMENSYQALGFLLSALLVWLGIRRHWHGLTNTGSTFFVIFLYTKLFDWWWEWLPKYLFFLILGLIALLLLMILKRLRSALKEVAQ
ncbi:MAG: DUF2157 domain-containing protein [Desulfuromonadaceae bacterium]